MIEQVIRFSEIEADEQYKTRPVNPEDISRIDELIGLGEYPPPMIVCKAGARYLLLDGFDRHKAWARAFSGHDGEVKVTIADCPDEPSRFIVAIESNIKNPRNYTIGQIGALYARLTRELGFSKSEARKLLRLTPEHAERIDQNMIRMETTEEEATEAETTEVEERAGGRETSGDLERVGESEIPVIEERAGKAESPTTSERATLEETSAFVERADRNAIRFHVERLQVLIPPAWADARRVLESLAEMIGKILNEESEQ